MPSYTGSCHCGAVRFEVTAEIDHVRVCDCSICRRRGGLLLRVSEDQLKLQTPLEEMALYQFHTMTAKDYFCRICGILPFRRPRTAPDMWSVNVRCLEGIDLDAIPVKRVNGSRLS